MKTEEKFSFYFFTGYK